MLGGSWVVISGVISPLMWVISYRYMGVDQNYGPFSIFLIV